MGGGGEIQVQTCVNPPVEGWEICSLFRFLHWGRILSPWLAGYSQLWLRVVDFIPQLGTKNLASGGVGAEVGSLGHTVAPTPHPSISKEQMRLRIVSSVADPGRYFFEPWIRNKFFPDPGSQPELSTKNFGSKYFNFFILAIGLKSFSVRYRYRTCSIN